MTDRVEPHDLDAERCVLGGMMLSPDALVTVASQLRASDFYDPRHRAVFDAAGELNRRGEPVNALSVKAELERDDKLGQVGGAPYLHTLMESVPTAANAGYFAARVAERAMRRRLIAAGTRIAQLGYSEGEDVEGSLAVAEAELRHVGLYADTRITDLSTMGEFCDEVDDEHQWLIPGVLEVMDRVIVVASEGAGKSTLARQVAATVAAGTHPFEPQTRIPPKRTLYVDLENPPALIRRKSRHLLGLVRGVQGWDEGRFWRWTRPGGIDLRKPHDQHLFDRVLSEAKPALVCMGPLYKSFTDGGERAEQLNTQVAQVLDRMREKHQVALWLETHAPMEQMGQRSLRPLGSGVWSRWPEFGISLRRSKEEKHTLLVERFRGDRDERAWPIKLRRGTPLPWEAIYEDGHFGEGEPL